MISCEQTDVRENATMVRTIVEDRDLLICGQGPEITPLITNSSRLHSADFQALYAQNVCGERSDSYVCLPCSIG